MTELTTVTEVNPSSGVARAGVIKRLLKNPLGVCAIVFLLIMIVSSALATWLAPYDPNLTDLHAVLQSPGPQHLLGTDSAGRDVLSRLLWGGQITMLSAALAAGVALVLGVPAGLIAGYYAGWFDGASSWTTNIIMSLPSIVVLLAVRAALGPSVWISMTVFGVLLAPSFYRLVRTTVQAVRNELYVDAARVSGLGDSRIIGRHVLYVVRAPIIIQAATVAGIAISIQSGLEFLGLGDPLVPTWGVMLSEAFRNIYRFPVLLIWPGVAISATIASLAIFGNALRDALEDDHLAGKARRRLVRHSPRRAAVADSVEWSDDDSEHVLTVRNLCVGYPQAGNTNKEVVRDVSFHVDRGEVLGIVGESGSGKTQTAFAILGLLPENARIIAGNIRLHGESLVSSATGTIAQQKLQPLRGKRIAYIPQEPMSNLDPAFTIGHQLVRPMTKVLGISKEEARARALELLATVGIDDPERTFRSYAHEISGGMAQRVLIAGAVSCEPELLIADEPTTALDVTVQAEVLDLLRDLQRDRRMAVILVTHNFGVVADLCERVAVMQNGRIVEQGAVRDILRKPEDPYTKSLLEATLEGKTPMTMLNIGSGKGQNA